MTPLEVAVSEVGVREVGRNRGSRVEEYLASVGLEPGNPWCAAFVSWCLREAGELRLRSGSALKLLLRAPPWSLTPNPAPGAIFVIDHGGGLGHCGFVLSLPDDTSIETIEGNTSPGGSREGDGVYQRARLRAEINRGYIDLDIAGALPGADLIT